MNATKDDIARMLLESNIKPSYSRIKVMEYLLKNRNHPTADEMYSHLVKELPTLSKTTVYNTMDILIKSKLAQLISIEDHEARYDADMAPHGHFKCEECKMVSDFPIDMDIINSEALADYLVKEKHVYVKGICSNCMINNKQ